MKTSTLKPRHQLDVAGEIRAELARSRVTGLELADRYGGSSAYWSRRINGHLPLSIHDIECVADALGVHPAELLGGLPPASWAPRDLNPQPSD